jgi:hypothetical protein
VSYHIASPPSQSGRDFNLTDSVCVVNRQLGSLRPLLGMRPWTASDFALGATLIAPLEYAMPFGVLSPAALTDGLPIPDITSSLNDSVLIFCVVLVGPQHFDVFDWYYVHVECFESSSLEGFPGCIKLVWDLCKGACTNDIEYCLQTAQGRR